jgi:hypothetical protein
MTTGWWSEDEEPVPSFVLIDVSGVLPILDRCVEGKG